MPASSEFDLHATLRAETGKKAMQRLRAAFKVPAIVYGADKKPESITLNQKDVLKALSHEAIYSHILTLHIDGKAEKVVLKALERHPTKPQILHLDFYRIKAGEKIVMRVPVHFLNQEKAPGVKEGGVVSHLMNEIEIKCLPEHLPEYLEVDLSNLTLGNSILLSEIKLPKNVELAHELSEERNPGVVSIHHSRIEETVAAAPSAEEALTPEAEITEESEPKEEPSE